MGVYGSPDLSPKDDVFEGMVRCRKCGNAYHHDIKRCPYCGASRRSPVTTIAAILGLFIAIAILVSVGKYNSNMQKNNASSSPSNTIVSNVNEYNNSLSNVSSDSAREKYISSCKEIDYKSVARNPDKYVGEKLAVKGLVLTTFPEEGTDGTILIIYQDGTDSLLKLYVWAAYYYPQKGEDKVLTEDHVTVYGEFYDVLSMNEIGLDADCLRLVVKYYTIDN